MRKLAALLIALTLTACGTTPDPTPRSIPAADQSVSWHSLSIPLQDGWQIQEATEDTLVISEALHQIRFDRNQELPESNTDRRVAIGQQNYRDLSTSAETILSTSWEKQDLLITTDIPLDILQPLLEPIMKSKMTWRGHYFDRPGGMDWHFLTDTQTLVFIADDGNNLENELTNTQDSHKSHMLVYFRETALNLEEISETPSYTKDFDFDGARYSVFRYTSDSTGEEKVIYVGELDDEYIWIWADKAYDDDAQDILNEVIKL